jgi:hypothetical protein
VSVLSKPTAKQILGRGHEMPLSELKVAPGGFGVGTICQLAPFQLSATGAERRGSLIPVWVTALPTAMHEFADQQSTALRTVPSAPATFGVGDTVHAPDATEGVSNSPKVAIKTSRTDRRDIRPSKLRLCSGLVKLLGHLSGRPELADRRWAYRFAKRAK